MELLLNKGFLLYTPSYKMGKRGRYLENELHRNFICARNKDTPFLVYHIKNVYYTVEFTENKAYLCDRGRVIRKVKIISVPSISLQLISNPKNVKAEKIEESKKTETLNEDLFNELRTYGIRLNNKKTEDAFYFLNLENNINEIQLINSSNNHSSKHHEIENKVVTIAYYIPTLEKVSNFEIALHYCKKCNKFFDFKNSFMFQLNNNGIQAHNLFATIVDENNNPLIFHHKELNKHSRLYFLGYSVGKEGKTTGARQKLLSTIIENKYMTAVQIKDHLEFLIRLHKNNPNQRDALRCWSDDIIYINKIIRNKNKIHN